MTKAYLFDLVNKELEADPVLFLNTFLEKNPFQLISLVYSTFDPVRFERFFPNPVTKKDCPLIKEALGAIPKRSVGFNLGGLENIKISLYTEDEKRENLPLGKLKFCRDTRSLTNYLRIQESIELAKTETYFSNSAQQFVREIGLKFENLKEFLNGEISIYRVNSHLIRLYCQELNLK